MHKVKLFFKCDKTSSEEFQAKINNWIDAQKGIKIIHINTIPYGDWQCLITIVYEEMEIF